MIHKSSHLQSIGQTYHDFILTKNIEIPELQCVLKEVIHKPTDARIMYIGNDDPENLFCLSFQTLPYNSNGVAHILEHTVLCGSKKFPVKDPFFAMNRRSLNTFMNALTGSDFTCYPAASQVYKDFYNLLDVYLDAVFHPNLKELSFLQEGYRIEFENLEDLNSNLEFKGVVYNEMKGALSNPSARLAEAINENLFPNITYGFNSGGDPKVIPQLTYRELIEFHKLYYHPSRCLFFFYGNMPLEGHLDFIAKNILNESSKAAKLPPIPPQPRLKAPVHRTYKYPIAPDEEMKDKTFIALGWLSSHILEQEETLALTVLQSILLDTDASPLKMVLLQSGLCKQVSYFIDSEINEVPLGIIFRGCNPENSQALEDLVRTTLKEISDKGIPLETIENAIHQMEFARSEITGDVSPFGLSLFMRSALLKQHGVEPEQGLVIHSLFDQIRQSVINDPLYFSSLIDKYYLNNTHFINIVMEPDPTLQEKEETEEKQLLDRLKKELSKKEREQVVTKAKELLLFQKEQENENIDVLPKISITEVPLNPREYPLKNEKVGEIESFYHNAFTNEIVYADLTFNLPNFSEDDLPYLHLFLTILPQVGCNGRNYVENLDYIQGNTGGISASINLNLQARNHLNFNPLFHLRGKALYRKTSKLFPLMLDTITSADFSDTKRIKEILFKHFTGLESRINQNALRYAINLASSALSVPSKVANQLYGLPFYWKLRDLMTDFEKNSRLIISKLKEIQEKIRNFDHPHLVMTCDSNFYKNLKDHGFYGLKNISTSFSEAWQENIFMDEVPSQGRIIASSVAFIAKVIPAVSYIHPDAPALNIAAHLLDNLTLHPRIREQGGAYGSGAVNNPMSGNFYLYSYRDPNIARTLNVFQEAIDNVVKGNFNESDLEEAKLEMIQSFDAPISPGSRGELAYARLQEGKTYELRQRFRAATLELTPHDVINAVKNVIQPQFNGGSVVVFAGKSLLEEENRKLEADGMKPLIIEGI